MKVKDFKRILQRISDLYGAAGATDQAKAVGHVLKALDSHDDTTVEDFVKAKTAKPSPSPAGNALALPNEQLINKHATSLLDAGIDKAKFEAALTALKADKGLSDRDLYAATNAYTNRPSGGAYKFTFKSRKAAIEKITSIFVERMEAQSKRDIIEKMTPLPETVLPASNPARSASRRRGS